MATSSKIQKLQMKKALAMSNGDLHKQREACHNLIELHMEGGRAEDEKGEWTDMARIARAMTDKNLEMRAHRQIVELGIKVGEYDESVESCDRYVQLAKESEDRTELQRALVTKGRLCYHRSKMDEAERLYQMALRAVDKTTVSQKEKSEMRLGCWYNLYHLDKQRGMRQEELEGLLEKVSRAARAEQLHAWSFRSSLELADMAFRVGDDEEAGLKWKEAAGLVKHLSKEEAEIDLVNFYFLKSRMLLRKRNFREAKNYLDQVANKEKHMAKDPQVCNFRRGMRKLVRAATRLERCKEGGPGRQRLLEKLGDLTSKLELNVIAAKYYSDSLSCPEGVGLSDEEKAGLHYSVATCLYEAGRFQEAVASFKKEIALWVRLGQVESAASSWAKLARAMVKVGQPFQAVEKELNEALNFVRKKKVAAEEVKLLRFLAKLQTDNSLHAEAEESLRTADSVVESNKVDADNLECYEEDGIGEGDDEFSSDSEADEADEEEEEGAVGRSKRKRGLKMRRNQLGETELHTKCKEDGNKEDILRLIKAGAPVDVTDKFDFTPLLEACNHGFLEYVRILHSAGANLNWVGGKEDRVSALIDACSGGHLDIASYLMDHGANVFHQDKDGWMAKDHLEYYLKENEGDMREEDVKMAKSLLGRMKKSLEIRAKSGQSVYVLQKKARSSALVADGDNPNRVLIEDDMEPRQSRRPHRRDERFRDDDGDLSDDNSKRRRMSDEPALTKGASVYRKAMASLRRKNDFDQDQDSDSDVEKENRRSQQVPNFAKRKHSSLDKKKSRSQANSEDDFELPDISESRVISTPTPPSVVEIEDLTTSSEVIPRQPSHAAAILPTNTGCYTVVLEGKRLRVPLNLSGDSDKVRHLASAAADRHASATSTSARPILAMTTSDGAELHPDDPVTAVLAGESEVHARITGWNLPPIKERYSEASGGDNHVFKDVLGKLEEAERSGRLSLFGLALGVERSRPVFRALAHSANLSELILSSNRLFDEGVKHLSITLPTLSGLQALDLSTNGLTDKSVTYLLDCAKNSKSLKSLKVLNLSFNFLGDACGRELAELTSLLDLNKLELASCGLSESSKVNIRRCSDLVKIVNVRFNLLKL